MSAFQPYNPDNEGQAFNQDADPYSFGSPITDEDNHEQEKLLQDLIDSTRASLKQNSEARHD